MSSDSTINALHEEKTKLLERIKKVDAAIEILSELGFGDSPKNGTVTNPVQLMPLTRLQEAHQDFWDLNAPMKIKVMALVKGAGKFCHVKQLTALARKMGEPDKIPTSKQTLQERISNTLTALRMGNHGLEKIQIGSAPNAFVWGLKEWVDNDKIKPEFMFNE